MLDIIKLVEYDFDAWGESDRYINLYYHYAKAKEIDREEVREVDAYSILACAWNNSRLYNLCKGDIAKIIDKNPPRVCAYQTKSGKYIYTISDGNHRVICARIRGLKKVKVKIECRFLYPNVKAVIRDNMMIVNGLIAHVRNPDLACKVLEAIFS